MTVRDWVTGAKRRLSEAGIEASDLEAQLLAAHVLLVDRPWLMAHSDEPFPELAGESVLARRTRNEPLSYILGWREFYGRRFKVRPGVLIPRHETEVLVAAALSWIDLIPQGDASVLDLGTGSGCIAVTLKMETPKIHVVASDISENAIEIASQNALELGAGIDFVLSDGFAGLGDRQFDAIVSNPPYIGLHEPLAPEVAEFEPQEALFSGETGMEFYERLATEAGDYLKPRGRLFLEVGYLQSGRVSDLFRNLGWTDISIEKDLSDIERVVICTAPKGQP